MTKNIFKFLVGGLLVVLVGGATLWVIQDWNYKNTPEYQAEQKMKELERQYSEDPYGGDTPEETLRLFIEALKAEDTDLASKYFVLDKQEEWKRDLALIKEKGLLEEMIKDVERAEKYSSVENRVIFTAGNESSKATANIVLVEAYNKWKIRDI